jgi:hypothetical protein
VPPPGETPPSVIGGTAKVTLALAVLFELLELVAITVTGPRIPSGVEYVVEVDGPEVVNRPRWLVVCPFGGPERDHITG